MASDLQLGHSEGAEMQVLNLMTPDPVTVTPDDTLSKAKRTMEARGFRRLPVMEGRRLVGIVTERDLREHSGFLESTRVKSAMRTQLVTIGPQNTVEDAACLMLQQKIGGLPIVANGRLIGIVTTTDLLRAYLLVVNGTAQLMNP